MFSHKYERLDSASKESLVDHRDLCQCTEQRSSLARRTRTIYIVFVILGLLILSNALLITRLHYALDHAHDSTFLNLERNKEMIIPHDNRPIDDPMWLNPEFDWNTGWIALDNQVAEAKGLPSSMRWPWDHSKSIYVLHGFHSMHCVFVIRDSLMQYHDNKPQTWPFEHVTHCLHVLREDTMCNAEDTPRYTGRLHAQENHTTLFSGVGQTRQCRDWGQLRQYAIEQSACYRRPLDHHIPLLDRYKFCPDQSTPWAGKES